MNKLYVIVYQEGLFNGSSKSRLFAKKDEAQRWIQNVKHIPHSEVVEVELKK